MSLISSFPRAFRGKPPRPTVEEGRAILQKAIAQTVNAGLEGFVIASLALPGKQGECIVSVSNAGLKTSLAKMLGALLEQSEFRTQTIAAMIAALRDSGSVQFVGVPVEDACPCPECVTRRKEEASRPTAH